MQINVKLLPGSGSSEGKWELIEFSEFLTKYSPQLAMHAMICKQFPPRDILNEELMSGGKDIGMGGGCFWNPFEISEDDYNFLRETMLTDPKLNLEYDKELEGKRSLKKWCGSVLSKHNPRRKK